MCPSFTIYEAGTSFDLDGDMKVCLLLVLDVTKRQTVAKSALVASAKVGVAYTDFQHYIFFSTCQDEVFANKLYSVRPVLGDWQSWEIGSPTSGAEKMKLSYCARIGHIYLMHSYILKDPPLHGEHCQCISDSLPHLSGVQSFC